MPLVQYDTYLTGSYKLGRTNFNTLRSVGSLNKIKNYKLLMPRSKVGIHVMAKLDTVVHNKRS